MFFEFLRSCGRKKNIAIFGRRPQLLNRCHWPVYVSQEHCALKFPNIHLCFVAWQPLMHQSITTNRIGSAQNNGCFISHPLICRAWAPKGGKKWEAREKHVMRTWANKPVLFFLSLLTSCQLLFIHTRYCSEQSKYTAAISVCQLCWNCIWPHLSPQGPSFGPTAQHVGCVLYRVFLWQYCFLVSVIILRTTLYSLQSVFSILTASPNKQQRKNAAFTGRWLTSSEQFMQL
jgi:hypothetical protein